ncbi:MAG: hypothetical protein AAGC49_12220 [Brevundimonas sp.]
MRSPRARSRRVYVAERVTQVLLGVAFLAAAGLVSALTMLYTDARDHTLARQLHATGITTTAHDGQIRPDCQSKGCSDNDRVRVTADLPDGPHVLELRGVYPDIGGLPTEKWSNAPAGNQYAGDLTVVYDQANLAHVMEAADLRRNLQGSDLHGDQIVAASCAAVVLLALSPPALQLLSDARRRPAHRSRGPRRH